MIKEIVKIIVYGIPAAREISFNKKISFVRIYFDIIVLCTTNHTKPSLYLKDKVYAMDEKTKRDWCRKKLEEYKKQAEWEKLYYSNYRFLAKWSKEYWSGSRRLSIKRANAYKRHYMLTNRPIVQYGVQIICEHKMHGKLDIGKNVYLLKDSFLDYTGDIIIKDNVFIAFGAVVQTHYHEDHSDYRESNSVTPTSLIIESGAVIGSRAIIMPSCHYIGKYARVGAGSVVTHDVPDYAIVVGSPAKVIRIQK